MTGKNIIGETLSSSGKEVFYGENPATGQKLEPAFYEATEQEINNAIEKASEAFQTYRTVSGKDKAAFLETIADEILALGDDLIKRGMEETGLPEARLTGERGRTVGQLTFCQPPSGGFMGRSSNRSGRPRPKTFTQA